MSIALILAAGFVLLGAVLVAYLRRTARREGFAAVLGAGLVVITCGYLGAHLVLASLRGL